MLPRLRPGVFVLSVLAILASHAARAQPHDLDAWRVVESPNVRLLTDAEPRRGAEVAATLERFRTVFDRLAPGLELEAPAPTQIIAFRNAETYAPYRRGGGRGVKVLGQFQTTRDGNVLTLDANPRYVGAFAVIYHEYVHYLVGSNLPDVPRWFNEGLAEYYSSFETDDEVVRIGGPVPRHMAWFARHGVPSVVDLISADAQGGHRAVGRHGADAVGAFYGGSWLLVHYLLSGDAERLDQAAYFLARVAHGEDPIGALEDAFDIRASDLDEAVAAHAESGFVAAEVPIGDLGDFEIRIRPSAPADTLAVLGDVAGRMGDLQGAARHFHAALDHVPQHAGAHAGLAWVRHGESRYDEARVLFGDAFAIGTDDPVAYLRWGRHLLTTTGDGVGARAAFRRVTELDSSFAEGWALHGIAHLAADSESPRTLAEEGIPSLQRAIARLPARVDLVAALVSLEVRAHRFDIAEQRVEHTLVGRADDAVVESAREEIARGRLLAAAEAAFADERYEDAKRFLDEAIDVTRDAEIRERLEARLRWLTTELGG